MVPEQLLLKLIAVDPHPVFVETGTFRGGTTLWAAKHFKEVITIELRPELSRLLRKLQTFQRISVFSLAITAKLLPAVISQVTQPAVFWLDGHYCGPGTGDELAECPIIAELQALITANKPIILIDDARSFSGLLLLLIK